jgi:hypothetical protein
MGGIINAHKIIFGQAEGMSEIYRKLEHDVEVYVNGIVQEGKDWMQLALVNAAIALQGRKKPGNLLTN